MSFGIVGAVPEETVDRQVSRGLHDRRHKVGRIVVRTIARLQGGDQIHTVMRHQGRLRVAPVLFHAAGAGQKVTAEMMVLDDGRINRGIGTFFDQATLLGDAENGSKQSLKSPFLRSRA